MYGVYLVKDGFVVCWVVILCKDFGIVVIGDVVEFKVEEN